MKQKKACLGEMYYEHKWVVVGWGIDLKIDSGIEAK
jgi:hypothetical protein